MENKAFYRSRLRPKGQITVPSEIREILHVEEGDELVFAIDENGKVIVDRVLIVSPEQAWFWSERWQRLEHLVEQDIEEGKVYQFPTSEEAIVFLNKAVGDRGAKDPLD